MNRSWIACVCVAAAASLPSRAAASSDVTVVLTGTVEQVYDPWHYFTSTVPIGTVVHSQYSYNTTSFWSYPYNGGTGYYYSTNDLQYRMAMAFEGTPFTPAWPQLGGTTTTLTVGDNSVFDGSDFYCAQSGWWGDPSMLQPGSAIAMWWCLRDPSGAMLSSLSPLPPILSVWPGYADNYLVVLGCADEAPGATGWCQSSHYWSIGSRVTSVELVGVEQPPGATPVGVDVTIAPVDPATGASPATLEFSDVTGAGVTTVTTSSTGAPPPQGFRVGNPPVYFDLTTTATYVGAIEVCIDYAGIQFGRTGGLKLFHYQGGAWVDITTRLDASVICGITSSLSPFAVFEPWRLVDIDVKPGSYPNTINLGSNGSVAVAILGSPTFDATTVVPSTVTVQSAPVALKGKGTLMYSLEDVDGDGRTDMVVHVATEALLLSDTDTQAVLEGQTRDGTFIRGVDSIRVVQ